MLIIVFNRQEIDGQVLGYQTVIQPGEPTCHEITVSAVQDKLETCAVEYDLEDGGEAAQFASDIAAALAKPDTLAMDFEVPFFGDTEALAMAVVGWVRNAIVRELAAWREKWKPAPGDHFVQVEGQCKAFLKVMGREFSDSAEDTALMEGLWEWAEVKAPAVLDRALRFDGLRYATGYGTDPDAAPTDILADLMLWCADQGHDFWALLRSAINHSTAEGQGALALPLAVLVEGGVVQEASAPVPLDLDLYDLDDARGAGRDADGVRESYARCAREMFQAQEAPSARPDVLAGLARQVIALDEANGELTQRYERGEISEFVCDEGCADNRIEIAELGVSLAGAILGTQPRGSQEKEEG